MSFVWMSWTFNLSSAHDSAESPVKEWTGNISKSPTLTLHSRTLKNCPKSFKLSPFLAFYCRKNVHSFTYLALISWIRCMGLIWIWMFPTSGTYSTFKSYSRFRTPNFRCTFFLSKGAKCVISVSWSRFTNREK